MREKTARLLLSDLDRFLSDYLTSTDVKVHLEIYPCYFGAIRVVWDPEKPLLLLHVVYKL